MLIHQSNHHQSNAVDRNSNDANSDGDKTVVRSSNSHSSSDVATHDSDVAIGDNDSGSKSDTMLYVRCTSIEISGIVQ